MANTTATKGDLLRALAARLEAAKGISRVTRRLGAVARATRTKKTSSPGVLPGERKLSGPDGAHLREARLQDQRRLERALPA
eukprot:711355-Alexandrium_andersonii.AAC.1